MPRKTIALSQLLTVIGASMVLFGCQHLPPQKVRPETSYLADTQDTTLGLAIEPHVASHESLDGVYELEDPHDAFVARAAIATLADKTLDAQYYIWRPDTSGKMLLNDLYTAANRGVRVRLLLDDNNTRGMDDILAALSAHPNIEVRLFNPFTNRKLRSLGYVTDFDRLNRRMHNKSMIADNQVAILGGRNVGDEYFAAGDGMVFADMDVMTVGPVVTELSKDFDRYWASELSYPFKDIVKVKKTKEYADQLFDRKRIKFRADKQDYLTALQRSPLLEHLKTGQVPWLWSPTQLVSDDPIKATGKDEKAIAFFSEKLDEVLGSPKKSAVFVSPYFVPTEKGVEVLAELSEQHGVKVSVLTNSLEATDVSAVHSGYARYRKALLQSGVELFELKKQFTGKAPASKDKGLVGSSASSLHAKTFIVDDKRVFVGSLNLDPRSALINTEMGLVIENPALAKSMTRRLNERMQERAYQVTLQEDGKHLQWTASHANGPSQVYTSEPNVGLAKRAWVKFLSWLPIEGLL